MAKLRLNIGGPPGSIPAEAFMAALKHELAILRDLDIAISGNPKGSVYWVIDDLKIGSAICDIRSIPYAAASDHGAEVSRSILAAINSVETENKTPAYISASGMQNVKNLVEIPRRYRLQGQLSLSDAQDGSAAVTVTEASSEHLKELMPVKFRSKGSVEGRLEAINTHGKSRFTLYESRSNRAISCLFDYDAWIETVKNSLRRKVTVSGDLLANVRGETLRVDVKDIRPIKPRGGVSIRDLDGIDPDFTGGLKSEVYVRRMRSA